MRLEQRIGRVDRIGQQFDTVWIWSYFLKDTIEAEVYRRLMDRIDWFQYVVGSLQPILHQVGRTIQKLVLEPGESRSSEMDKALIQITADIAQSKRDGIEFDRHLAQSLPPAPQPPPATAEQLEQFFTTSQALGQRFRSHPDIKDAFRVEWEDREHLATFSAELANERSDTLRLLTFGDALFEAFLNKVKPPTDTNFGLIRLETQLEGRLRAGWYRNLNGQTAPIRQLSHLTETLYLETGEPVSTEQAEQEFAKGITNEADQQRRRLQRIDRERRSALIAQGRHLLTQAAYNWAARQRTLFDAGNTTHWCRHLGSDGQT